MFITCCSNVNNHISVEVWFRTLSAGHGMRLSSIAGAASVSESSLFAVFQKIQRPVDGGNPVSEDNSRLVRSTVTGRRKRPNKQL